MIDVSLVTERFLMLASMAQADETVETLCQSGAKKIEKILKENVDLTDDRLIFAAASDAFYNWILINKAVSDDDFKSFRAGDITVENDVSVCVNAAQKIKNEAFEAITDLLDDREFYFGEVLIDDFEPTL